MKLFWLFNQVVIIVGVTAEELFLSSSVYAVFENLPRDFPTMLFSQIAVY